MNMKASAAASPEVHTRIQQAMQAAPPEYLGERGHYGLAEEERHVDETAPP